VKKKKKIIKKPGLLVFSILISQLAGILGSLATMSAIPSWYAALNKPSFNPPNWIFGPVWTTLYTLMGIALYLIWIKNGKKKKHNSLIAFFLTHLVFNTLWSLIFFGLKNIGLALIIILFLWSMIFYLIKAFYPIDKRASYLLIPYLAWVSFATLLNFSLMVLN
jgi:tryptophan-rich sensory protein